MITVIPEETNEQIDSLRQKTDDIGNVKVSELLSFGLDEDTQDEDDVKQ